MKITISKEIIDRVTDNGTVVSRIPKTNKYLYLHPDAIVSQGEFSISAEIDETSRYTVGEKDLSKGVTMMLGAKLAEHYAYEQQYDPDEQKARNEQNQEARKEEKVAQQKQPENAAQGTTVYKTAPQQAPDLQQKYSKEQFRQLKLGQKHHLDISQYWDIRLSAEQMKQLRLMQENAIDIAKLGYNDPSVPVEVLNELRLGHNAGYNMQKYDWRHMTAKQLSQIRLGLEHNIDVAQYAYSAYTDVQMKQLRLALQNNLDITPYRNPRFTEEQMYRMRCSQLLERIKEKLKELFDSVKRLFQESSLNQIKTKIMEKVSDGLEKTADFLSREDLMQDPFGQRVQTETLDDRIQETVQDIKELLVAQELVSENVLYDEAMSVQMNAQIKEALDKLMQPENIQNMKNQEEILTKAAENVMEEAGVDLTTQSIKQEQTLAQLQEVEQPAEQGQKPIKVQLEPNEWSLEGLTDKEIFERIGEEMLLEEQITQGMDLEP